MVFGLFLKLSKCQNLNAHNAKLTFSNCQSERPADTFEDQRTPSESETTDTLTV